MLTWIRPLLSLPRFEDPTTERQARLLTLFLGAAWIASLVMGLGYDMSTFNLPPRWQLLGIFWLALLAAYLLVQRGQVRIASVLFLLAAFFLINERIWFAYGGVVSPFMAMLLLIVICAGYLLGIVGGYLFTGLGMLAIMTMFSLSATLHPDRVASGELQQLMVLWSLMLMFAALLQHGLGRSLERSESEAANRLDELERSNLALLELQANLENHVQGRTAEIERERVFYRSLVENAPLAVVTLDSTHRIVSWNPAFEQMFGWLGGSLAGKDLDEVVTDHETREEARELTRRVKAGEPIHAQGVRCRADGSPLHVELFGVPVAVAGQQDGILAIYNDITSRVISERAHQLSDLRYRQAVLHSPNPIFTVDTLGVIQTWNPACVRAFQYEYDILGQSYQTLLSPTATQAGLARMVDEVLGGGTHQGVDIFYRCADGSELHMISRIYPLVGEDNQVTGCVFANTDITEREQMAEALRASELRLRGMLEQARDGVVMVDETGLISSWNPAMEALTGYPAEQMCAHYLWDVIFQLTPPDQQTEEFRQVLQKSLKAVLAKEQLAWNNQLNEHEIERTDGQRLTLQSVVFPIVLQHGVIAGMFSRDITEQARTAERLQEFYGSIGAVMDGLGVGVYCCDMESGEILLANPYLQQVFGSQLEGEHCFERFYGRVQPCQQCNNHKLLAANGLPTSGLVWEDYNPVVQRWYLNSGRAIQWHDGRYVRLEVAVDITERKEAEQRLEFMATHDALTRLPNRTLLADRLQHAVAAASRSGEKLAVVFLDIDNFKQVNDSSGHLAGDLVLGEVARRLRACLRAADTVARSGGDEFILILENVLQEKDVSATMERILQSMARPFEVDTNRFYLSASLGISLYPDDSLTLDGLLVAADSAMYQAKRSGKNQCWYASHGVDDWLTLNHPDRAREADES